MSVKFDVKLTSQDMYRFNIHHAYTSLQGILSLVLGVFIIAVIIVSDQFRDFISALPYVALALVFFLYIPITLWFRSKRQIAMSEVLRETLHYELTDEGIVVKSDALDEEVLLPWGQVYKAITTRNNFLIYSNRVNAYIIPKAKTEDKLLEIYDAFEKHCEAYRLKIKR